MTKDLYVKREKIISQIPNFWALVLEQSPPEIDEFIQPTDAALLLTSLDSIAVERFELPNGDPRSVAIKFEFAENEHFENTTLEKKFYWRRANDGWAGLVSEPVDIKWKEGKDLTGGLLDLSRKVWEEEKASGKSDEETETKKQLKEKMENTGLDAVSFFCWFGFRGRNISDEEHAEATKKEQEKRQAHKDGKEIAEDKMDEDDEEDDDDEYEFEIFPTADDLAVTIVEDLWPNAIKYFSKCQALPRAMAKIFILTCSLAQAQEQEAMSDMDFEDDDEDVEEDDDDENGEQPSKKRKV